MAAISKTSTPAAAETGLVADALAAMRSERDRYIALAFCWADVLFELDCDGRVIYAAGALDALFGRPQTALLSTSFADLTPESERQTLDDILTIARKQRRVEYDGLRVIGPRGENRSVAVAGFQLRDRDDHYFLALHYLDRDAAGVGAAAGAPNQSLYDAEGFAGVVERRIGALDEDPVLSLLVLDDYDALHARLGADDAELERAVAACLKAYAIDGDAAGRIASDRYGVLVDAAVDTAKLRARIAEITRRLDPQGRGANLQSAEIKIDRASLGGGDIAEALAFTIRSFGAANGGAVTLQSLAADFPGLVHQTANAIAEFRDLIEAGGFRTVFQPILDARSGAIHHYEALARFPDGGGAYERITFAEQTTLIVDFDLAMVAKVVDWMLRNTSLNSALSVAVNVSGRSVGDPRYVEKLGALLRDNPWTRNRLLFEITESSAMRDVRVANDFIQGLRRQGYRVCLDDLGAGAANFSYLAAIEVDIVKIDGAAIKTAQQVQMGRAFLRALVKFCRELNVQTVAEMIEDENSLRFVRECGVEFVQGYLFGRPASDIALFRGPAPERLFGRRRWEHA